MYLYAHQYICTPSNSICLINVLLALQRGKGVSYFEEYLKRQMVQMTPTYIVAHLCMLEKCHTHTHMQRERKNYYDVLAADILVIQMKACFANAFDKAARK